MNRANVGVHAMWRHLIRLVHGVSREESAIDRLVAERGARRGQGSLLDALEELPEPIAGPSTAEVIEGSRAERV